MKTCGDHGGRTLQGEPCLRPEEMGGRCFLHREGELDPKAAAAAEGRGWPGRPEEYDEELASTVLRRMSRGETLAAICREEAMPARGSVYRWRDEDRHGFRDRYARARIEQLEHWADETLSISEDGENDTYRDEDGNVRVDYDVIQRSKLRVDTRKWLVSKLHPEFMDKQRLEHVGSGGGPVTIRVVYDEPVPDA